MSTTASSERRELSALEMAVGQAMGEAIMREMDHSFMHTLTGYRCEGYRWLRRVQRDMERAGRGKEK